MMLRGKPLIFLGLLLFAAAAGAVPAAESAAALLARSEEYELAGRDGDALAAARSALRAATVPRDRAMAMVRISRFLLFSDPAEARSLMIRAIAIQRPLFGDRAYETQLARTQLAILEALQGDRARQIPIMAAASRGMAETAATPREREQAAAGLLTAAQFADSSGLRDLSDATAAEGIALLRRPDIALGGDAAQAWSIAADLAGRHGRDAEALALAERSVRTWEGAGSRNPSELSQALSALAESLMRLGRHAEAEAPLRRAIAIADAADGISPHARVLAYRNLAAFYRDTGRPALAAPLLASALATAEAMPRGFRYAIDVARDLIDFHLAQGDPVAARAQAEHAIGLSAGMLGRDSAERAALLLMLARIDAGLRDLSRATADLRAASAIYDKLLSRDDPRRGDALYVEGLLLEADRRHAESADLFLRAIDAMAARSPLQPELIAARTAAARALLLAGDGGTRSLPLARAAVDATTVRLVSRARLTSDQDSPDAEIRSVYDIAVEAAWAKAHGAATR